MEARILKYLLEEGKPVSARAIAKGLGLKTPRDVNPTLYAMQKRGALSIAKQENPPLWSVRAKPFESARETGDFMVDALQWSLEELKVLLSSQEFQSYMLSGNNVRRFAAALYDLVTSTKDTDPLREALLHDTRDKQHSVAYLKMFRQAIIDDEKAVAMAVAVGCNYPVDLIADALQEDRDVTPFPNEAYLTILEKARTLPEPPAKDKYINSFLQDYLAYRVVTYHNQDELLANLIAIDDVSILWLVDELSVDTLRDYIEWKYAFETSGRRNEPGELLDLLHVLRRIPDGKDKQELRLTLLEEVQVRSVIFEGRPEEDSDAAQNMGAVFVGLDPGEAERRMTLASARAQIFAAEQGGVEAQGDANRVLIPIVGLQGDLADVKVQVKEIIIGRYRYLLAKRR